VNQEELKRKLAEAHAAVNAAGGRLNMDNEDYLDELDRPLALGHLERALDALDVALAMVGATPAELDVASRAYSERVIAEGRPTK
jgi:hypothetical protein